MDYKKKYERAIENLKKIKEANKDNNELVDFIEYEYPELKESEDERIRKELIEVFEERVKLCFEWKNGIPNNAVLAWLAKQGEQGVSEVHPIFGVGDYIKNKKTGDEVFIEQLDVKSKAYYYTGYDGAATIHSDFPFSKQDEWELIGQKIVEQNPWSEEDDGIIMMIEDRLSDYLDYIWEDSTLTNPQKNSVKGKVIGCVDWLKSLKDRVQPQNK